MQRASHDGFSLIKVNGLSNSNRFELKQDQEFNDNLYNIPDELNNKIQIKDQNVKKKPSNNLQLDLSFT